MHYNYLSITVYLLWVTANQNAALNDTKDDSPSSLIDSLVISRDGNANKTIIKSSVLDQLAVSDSIQESNRRNSYRLASRLTTQKASRTTVVLDTTNLSEVPCPGVICFTQTSRNDGLTYLNCSRSGPSNGHFIDLIDCHYWKSHTSHKMSPTVETSDSSVLSEGRGYDLKVILRPKRRPVGERQLFNTERRIQVDYLSEGSLDWMIKTMRHQLQLRFSPVHLTISFIYIVHLRRIDLANLPTKNHVTRMNIWNPFNWEDDSFIPVGREEQRQLRRFIQPTYFRLTVFCDHANRKPAFHRLWLPWKSWLVQFEHCHNLFACHSWISQYAICDRSGGLFEPTYFIHPMVSSRGYPSGPNVAGLQRLYNGQCQREPSPWDPLNDMEMNHEVGCWQQDFHTKSGQPNGSKNSPLELTPVGREEEKSPKIDMAIDNRSQSSSAEDEAQPTKPEKNDGVEGQVSAIEPWNNDEEVNDTATSSKTVENDSAFVSESRQLNDPQVVDAKGANRKPAKISPTQVERAVDGGTTELTQLMLDHSQTPFVAIAGGSSSKMHLIAAVVILSVIVMLLTVILLFIVNHRRKAISVLPQSADPGESTSDTSSAPELMFMNTNRNSLEHFPIISTNGLQRTRGVDQHSVVAMDGHLKPWLRNEPWEMHRISSGKLNPWASLLANRKAGSRSTGKRARLPKTGCGSSGSGIKLIGGSKRVSSTPYSPGLKRHPPRSPLTHRKTGKPHTLVFESGENFDVPENWPTGLHSFPNNSESGSVEQPGQREADG